MDIDVFGVIISLPPFGQLVFLMSAGLGILAGFMMITRNNAVHSALWLVLAFFNLAVMYVMLGAEFLAALQVLVYTALSWCSSFRNHAPGLEGTYPAAARRHTHGPTGSGLGRWASYWLCR